MVLLKAEGRTNLPDFFDEEGYMLLASSTEKVFHPIMEEMSIGKGAWKTPLPAGLAPRSTTNTIALSTGEWIIKSWTMGWRIQ